MNWIYLYICCTSLNMCSKHSLLKGMISVVIFPFIFLQKLCVVSLLHFHLASARRFHQSSGNKSIAFVLNVYWRYFCLNLTFVKEILYKLFNYVIVLSLAFNIYNFYSINVTKSKHKISFRPPLVCTSCYLVFYCDLRDKHYTKCKFQTTLQQIFH